jgi:hypothetical protein
MKIFSRFNKGNIVSQGRNAFRPYRKKSVPNRYEPENRFDAIARSARCAAGNGNATAML